MLFDTYPSSYDRLQTSRGDSWAAGSWRCVDSAHVWRSSLEAITHHLESIMLAGFHFFCIEADLGRKKVVPSMAQIFD